ncbi:hypothetical protein [Sphingopyxis sp.]|jgi:hypothetical protein|uniref:hypothetical protein n=1 Tax=Sphingopyxis sp. TaxID=1908224 RepID=UPI003F72D595
MTDLFVHADAPDRLAATIKRRRDMALSPTLCDGIVASWKRYGVAGRVFGIGLFAALSGMSSPALACADLPHVCAQKKALEDMAAPPPKPVGADGEEAPPYFDGAASRISAAGNLAEFIKTKSKKEFEEKMKDPKFAAFVERYNKGGWEFFPSPPDSNPGEYCSAFYIKRSQFILIVGPGPDLKGGLVLYLDDGIPKPRTMKPVEITFDQGDGSPQTVTARNQKLPGGDMGFFALTIPSIENLLTGMEDEAVFTIKTPGYLGTFEWNDGLTARKELEKCMSAGGRT